MVKDDCFVVVSNVNGLNAWYLNSEGDFIWN